MLEKLQEELKKSMKQRNELRTSVLRMLISDVKYAQIDKGKPLEEGDFLQVVKRAIKRRKESVETYTNAGRNDLAEQENQELKILEEFAPAEMTEDQVRQKIDEVINELGATEKKDLGRVMKEVLSRHKGQIDGKLAQKIVSEKLS